jgi:hypothetical protein
MTFDASQMPTFTHLNNGCDCQSCRNPKKDAPWAADAEKGFFRNGFAFAASRQKCPQAIDASGPSGSRSGRAMSAESGQQRQCVFLDCTR